MLFPNPFCVSQIVTIKIIMCILYPAFQASPHNDFQSNTGFKQQRKYKCLEAPSCCINSKGFSVFLYVGWKGFLGVYMQSKNVYIDFIYKLLFRDSLGAPPCLPHVKDGDEERIHTKQSSQVHNLLLQFDGQKVAVSFFKNSLLWSSFSLQTGSSLLVTTWIKMRVFSAL